MKNILHKINKGFVFDVASAIALLVFSNLVVYRLNSVVAVAYQTDSFALLLNLLLCLLFISTYFIFLKSPSFGWSRFFCRAWRVMGAVSLYSIFLFLLGDALFGHSYISLLLLFFTPGVFFSFSLTSLVSADSVFLVVLISWIIGVCSVFFWTTLWTLIEFIVKKIKARKSQK